VLEKFTISWWKVGLQDPLTYCKYCALKDYRVLKIFHQPERIGSHYSRGMTTREMQVLSLSQQKISMAGT